MKFIIVLAVLFRFGIFINCNKGNDQSKLFNVDNPNKINNHYALESEKLKNSAVSIQPLSNNKNTALNLNNFQLINPSPEKNNELASFFQNQPIAFTSSNFNFPFLDNKSNMNNLINKQGGRRSFTNRIKSFVNSLFWKDNSNSYLPSDSTNFFTFKQLPSFKFLNPLNNDQSSISSFKENFADFTFQNKPISLQNFDYNFLNEYKSLSNSYNPKPKKFIVSSSTNKINDDSKNNDLVSNLQTSNLFSFPENKKTNLQSQQPSNNINSQFNPVNPYPKVTNFQNYKNDFGKNNQNDKSLSNFIKSSDALVLNIDNNFIKSLQ